MIGGVLRQKPQYHPVSGDEIDPGYDYTAEFRWGRCPKWAEEVALDVFPFRQVPDGMDPLEYLSSYDTDMEARIRNWDPETKQLVEEKLLSHVDHGVAFVQVEVPTPAITMPWASYEKTQWKKIASIATELGVLEEALAYERIRDDGPRPGVLAALEEAQKAEELVAA